MSEAYQGIVKRKNRDEPRYFGIGRDNLIEYAHYLEHHAGNVEKSLWLECARSKEGLLLALKRAETKRNEAQE